MNTSWIGSTFTCCQSQVVRRFELKELFESTTVDYLQYVIAYSQQEWAYPALRPRPRVAEKRVEEYGAKSASYQRVVINEPPNQQIRPTAS